MKYYIIENKNSNISNYYNYFVVKAKNKKEAFDYFWKEMSFDNQEVKEGYVPLYKKDFMVQDIGEVMKFNESRLIVIE